MTQRDVMSATTTVSSTAALHRQEVSAGDRFEFGKNWQAFLSSVDEPRIRAAEASLLSMLRCHDLAGRTFLDIGCGSGLFSLAARRQGARVHSFDFDADSVACARELRRRLRRRRRRGWTIEQGSVLDRDYMAALGRPTSSTPGACCTTPDGCGTRWPRPAGQSGRKACSSSRSTTISARRAGDGARSRSSTTGCPRPLRPLLTAATIAPEEGKALARLTISGRPLEYLKLWTRHGDRGMNRWRDAVDWVGGYPYEVATPEAVFDFCRERGFTLRSLKCGGVGLGCNEFVFERTPTPPAA